MNDEQKKKEEIEEKGHEASTDELDALEPANDAAENSGPSEEDIPEDTDGMAEGNMFSSGSDDANQ